ncbi:MAG: MBL fold metallo-hydrolase, partial [Firmicutes bacterium]|nr:MBL fold metallo-hydrolase [Bacillota bacterium]
KPIELINTHADRDHISCNNQFEWAYMHPNELMHYKGNIKPVWDQDILDLGNRKVQIIHMPGHTPGSIGILDISHRVLFSGDSIQEDGMIFMFGSMRSIPVNILSLERLAQMDGFDTLYPSHAKCPIPKSTILLIKKQCEEILTGNVSYTTMDMHGNQVKAYKNEISTILTD